MKRSVSLMIAIGLLFGVIQCILPGVGASGAPDTKNVSNSKFRDSTAFDFDYKSYTGKKATDIQASQTWSAWMTAEELAALGRSPSDSNVESKMQYSDRTNTMDTVTTSSSTPPDGYTLLSDNSGWGAWSGWSDTPVTASMTRQVETRTVHVPQMVTEYRYVSWYNGSRSHFCGAYYSGSWLRYTEWSSTRSYPDQSDTWGVCGDYSHYVNGKHIGYTSYNGSVFYWTRYTIDGKNYYWEEQREVDYGYDKTQYRYRDYIYSYTYYKWVYGNWSAWTDSVLTDSDLNDLSYEVSTRKMYRFYLYNMSVTATGFNGTYDGNSHAPTVTVSGPSSSTVYYSISTQLTSSNYSSSGSTTKPTRVNAGESTVYYYVKDGTGNYTDVPGSTYIRILPKVSATAYSGTYDGAAHKPSVSATGSATLYYSTTTQLNYSNYSNSGSTTVPARTNAGTTTVYYIAVPASNPSANSCTTGQTTITISKKAMSVTASGFSGTYDGNSHAPALTVNGPSSSTIYYSTSTQLTSSNYSSSGSTTKPTRTNAGENAVYYYVKDGTGNYNDASGSTYIRILPKVTSTAYTGVYDGAAHKPTVSAAGSATIYYSTSTQLSYSNYNNSGSTAIPTRTNVGTTTVYYIAVPSSNASANSCTTGQTTITITKKAMSVSVSGYSGTYDGSNHVPTVTVGEPSNNSIYYSTSTQLTASNYSSSGTTTQPGRTYAGETTVYYYVKDGTGNYNDASGSTYIRVLPRVTATAYSGFYDGASHAPTFSVSGSAILYYSTSVQLTFANYSSSGSTTVPTRTNAGTTTVYYLAVPSSNASTNSCTTGQTTITISKKAMSVTASGYSGTYDGTSHSPTVTVNGPSSSTIYYSTSTQLTSSNYSSSGTTTKPTRTNAGEYTVYYFVKDGTGNYNDASGSTYIRISPKVTATSYSGIYDGAAHKPTVSAAGSATLYYSTSTQLTFANYSAAGSATIPSRTEEGTTNIYYLAVPSSNATANTCTAGTTQITILHNHIYAVTTEPTAASPGILTGTCPCGDTVYIEMPVLNTADYSFETLTEATCAESGTEKITWNNTNYGVISFTRQIASEAHQYQGTVTSPTCTEQGFTTYTCSVCGATYLDDFYGTLGHSYEQGVCVRCGAIDPDYTELVLMGDVDGDGDVTTADAVRLVRYLVELVELTPEQELSADVNHDSDITSADSIKLVRYLVGLEDSLEPTKRGSLGQEAKAAVITPTDVVGAQDELVTVPVTISGNPGFAGFTLEAEYPESLELTGIIPGSLLKNVENGSFTYNLSKGLINWNGIGNLTDDGELFCLTFRILDDTKDAHPIVVKAKDGKAGNLVDENGRAIHVNPFKDMPEKEHWAFEAINWALANGITAGTSATTFSPNMGCTRAQVVTFLWKAAGQPEPGSADNPFSDVTEKDYFYQAVLWAAENGITFGTGVGTFSPNKTCTRAQIVTFLWRSAGSPQAEAEQNPFADVNPGSYYEQAVLLAYGASITSGVADGRFAPNQTCTRAQIVTFLFWYYYVK